MVVVSTDMTATRPPLNPSVRCGNSSPLVTLLKLNTATMLVTHTGPFTPPTMQKIMTFRCLKRLTSTSSSDVYISRSGPPSRMAPVAIDIGMWALPGGGVTILPVAKVAN